MCSYSVIQQTTYAAMTPSCTHSTHTTKEICGARSLLNLTPFSAKDRCGNVSCTGSKNCMEWDWTGWSDDDQFESRDDRLPFPTYDKASITANADPLYYIQCLEAFWSWNKKRMRPSVLRLLLFRSPTCFDGPHGVSWKFAVLMLVQIHPLCLSLAAWFKCVTPSSHLYIYANSLTQFVSSNGCWRGESRI